MRKSLLIAIAALLAGAAVAIAQPGGGDPPDGKAIAAEASSFGECVSAAAGAGVENPAEACADLRPARNGEPRGGDQRSDSDNHAKACEEQEKRSGQFGRCVSERASAFGRCVADQAKSGSGNPTAACAHLKPGNGNGGNGSDGVDTAQSGPPEGVPTGKPEGTPSGPPAGVPAGKPEGTPSGPPAGVPSGKPEGTPAGPPAGVPSGKPEGTPGGPPAGVPSGKPEGAPGGPPG